MTLIIGVICEAAADQLTACEIADRIFCEKVDWIDHTILESQRSWRGFEENSVFLSWGRVQKVANQLKIKAHGHFGGEPAAPDAAAARRAIRIMLSITPRIDAILLIRDTDGDERRITGLTQAKQDSKFRECIVLGIANRSVKLGSSPALIRKMISREMRWLPLGRSLVSVQSLCRINSMREHPDQRRTSNASSEGCALARSASRFVGWTLQLKCFSNAERTTASFNSLQKSKLISFPCSAQERTQPKCRA